MFPGLIIILLFPFFSLGQNLFSEKIPAKRFFYGAVGPSYSRLQEDRLSPLVYSGIGLNGQFGYEKFKNKLYQRYSGNTGFYMLKNPVSTPLVNAQIYYSRFGANAGFYRQVFLPHELIWFYGIETSFHYLSRTHSNFYNNASVYTGFAGINAGMGLKYPFNLFKHTWVLSLAGQIPLLGMKIQQEYGSFQAKGFLDPETKKFPGFMKSLELASFLRFLSIQWNWDFKYYLTNGNYLSFGVVNSFISSPGKGGTRFRAAESGILLGAGFKF